MATYSFKSAGKTQETSEEEKLVESPIPYGIKTPLSYEVNGLAMNYDLGQQFSDNLRNLLQTNWGERLGLYNFGANLRPLLFSSAGDFDTQAIERIRSAVGKWMPFVELEEFSSTRNDSTSPNMVTVAVTYVIPAIDDKKRGVQIAIYAL